MGAPVPPVSTPDPDPVQAYVAEYSALTNRMTYWITLQYGIYAIAGATLGLFVKEFPGMGSAGPWALLLVLLLLAWAILQTVDEIVSTAVYIERDLRPTVVALLPTTARPEKLWGWELFLLEKRGAGMIHFERTVGLGVPFSCGLVAAVAMLIKAKPTLCSLSVSLWFIACAYVFVLVVIKFFHNLTLHAELDSLTRARRG
jgi:hypothetical protein